MARKLAEWGQYRLVEISDEKYTIEICGKDQLDEPMWQVRKVRSEMPMELKALCDALQNGELVLSSPSKVIATNMNEDIGPDERCCGNCVVRTKCKNIIANQYNGYCSKWNDSTPTDKPPVIKKQSCGNCHYWNKEHDECRRHSPETDPKELGYSRYWPNVSATLWCGDWEAATLERSSL